MANLLQKLFGKKKKKQVQEDAFGPAFKTALKLEVLTYYAGLDQDTINAEHRQALDFLEHNDLEVFPYDFNKNYDKSTVTVFTDENNGLPYVIFQDKKLYFKRSLDEASIQNGFNFLNIEQDPASPHRYITDHFFVSPGEVVMDIGAAEGNFSLSVIEQVSHVYLFETDTEWIEAMEATFAPWKEKVTIINKYVADIDDEMNISLDSFVKERGINRVDILKVDVEGAEKKLLTGAKNVLGQTVKKIAICTYHNNQDAAELSQILTDHHFPVTFSDGLMLFIYDPNKLKPPYFRKGLIRACK